jgi:hypothetical protein
MTSSVRAAGISAFLLHVMLPLIGVAILQDTMNKAVMRGLSSALPQARIAA